MADIKVKYGTATSLTVSGLNSLAAQGLATSEEVDNTGNLFIDIMVEVTIENVAEAGNKQVAVFLQTTLDGTNYSDAQSSNLYALKPVGYVPLNGTGPWRSATMSVAQANGGYLPPKFKLVIYNDQSGTALAASGNSVQYRGLNLQSI